MFTLKRISPSGVAAALQKAERYRLLNDSSAAESICRDIVEIDPENQQALIVLLLSITDQFPDELGDAAATGARSPASPTRRIQARVLRRDHLRASRESAATSVDAGSGSMAYESFREAMEWYEKAEAMRAGGKRRGDSALEHVRARARVRRSSQAAAGRAVRARARGLIGVRSRAAQVNHAHATGDHPGMAVLP